MQIPLQMVGVHRNATINIKNIQFTNGRGIVTGVDEHVGNLCRYLENYGAFPPHIAEMKQAEIDGEGDLLGIRAAQRKSEKADEMKAEANAEILRAQEAVEARLQAEAQEEREAAAAAALAAQERQAVAEEKAKALNGKVDDKGASEGRGREYAPIGKGATRNKNKNG